MSNIFEGVNYLESETGEAYKPCLHLLEEKQTFIPNTTQILKDYDEGKIDLQTARDMFFTEKDLYTILTTFNIGLDSFYLAANKMPNQVIQMNGQICYKPISTSEIESKSLSELIQAFCKQALMETGSLNFENKCLALENIVKSEVKESVNASSVVSENESKWGLEDIIYLILIFGPGVFLSVKILEKIWETLFGGDNNQRPSSGSGTTKSGIVIPTGGEVDRYGTRSESVSWRGALDLYYQQNGSAIPNPVDSNTNLPGVVDGLGGLTSPSFIPAYPGSILGPLPSPNPMPSFKPIPRLVPIPR